MYDLLPLRLTPERTEIVSKLLRRVAVTPTVFAEERACTEACIESEKVLSEMCPSCLERMKIVSSVLGAYNTMAWEVWDEAEMVGVIFFTNVTVLDAIGHYIFFDNSLATKTLVIKEAISEVFKYSRRITVEIPAPFVTLAHHAYHKLGFSGRYNWTLHKLRKKNKKIKVEGIKHKAAQWRGNDVDVLVLGLVRNDEARDEREQSPAEPEAPSAQSAESSPAP